MQISDIESMDPELPIQVEFNQRNPNWSSGREYNTHFIKIQEAILTDRLRALGYLFVNDVLDRLGIARIPEGQLLGWQVSYSDYVTLNVDPDSPDDRLLITIQPQGFIWMNL